MRAFVQGRLVVLVVVGALVLLVGAFVVLRLRAPSAPDAGATTGVAFLPDVRSRADAIDRIEIERGERKASLARSGDAWIAVDKADLPIESDRVRDLVRGLAGLQVEQPMTASKDRHAELELAWPSAKSNATLVRLFADGDSPPFAEVVAGKQRFSPPGLYVRKLGDDQTWRCGGAVTIEPDSIRMMNAVLVAIPSDALASIETSGAATNVAVLRDDTGAWKATSASGEPMADAKASEAARLLPELFTRLEFDDARRAATPPIAAVESIAAHVGDRTVTIELLPAEAPADDSAVVSGGAGSGRWFRVVFGPPEPGLGAAAPSEATIGLLDASGDRANGREFRLPAWRAGRLATLLAPTPPAKPDE